MGIISEFEMGKFCDFHLFLIFCEVALVVTMKYDRQGQSYMNFKIIKNSIFLTFTFRILA